MNQNSEKKKINKAYSWTVLCTMELRSLALGESEALGIERIPRARRMRMTKVHMMSMVSITVDDGDDDDDGFRPGSREYLGFAIFLA